ncbi:hypothetical protein [Flavobacterium sp. RS13.1]|uniref:hypothetical protein n=1 Tax=Flavobacterium sp. RS13.1 TaxID=3400345 RepID=UPI003AAAFA4B
MKLENLNSIIEKYNQVDTSYSEFLLRLKMFCFEDFLFLIERAESEGKRLYLKTDNQADAFNEGIYTDATIYLEDIGIR